MNTLLNFIKANRSDILHVIVLQALFIGSGRLLAELSGGNLWMIPNILYVLAIMSLCVHLPPLFIQAFAAETLGKFLNSEDWTTAWANQSTRDRWQFRQVLLVYLAFFAGLVILSAAVFLGTPVSG